jgi:hypothetical protein
LISDTHSTVYDNFIGAATVNLQDVLTNIDPIDKNLVLRCWNCCKNIIIPSHEEEQKHPRQVEVSLYQPRVLDMVERIHNNHPTKRAFRLLANKYPQPTSEAPDLSCFPASASKSWSQIRWTCEVETSLEEKEHEGGGQAISFAARTLQADDSRKLAISFLTDIRLIEIFRIEMDSRSGMLVCEFSY